VAVVEAGVARHGVEQGPFDVRCRRRLGVHEPAFDSGPVREVCPDCLTFGAKPA
jgi:hypothetical protein